MFRKAKYKSEKSNASLREQIFPLSLPHFANEINKNSQCLLTDRGAKKSSSFVRSIDDSLAEGR